MQILKVLTFITLGIVVAVAQSDFEYAYCLLAGTSNDPGITGYVEFTNNGANVDMKIYATGITQNLGVPHGIHIHQYGDISGSTGLQTGTHWDPNGDTHGCPGNLTRHYGDTGNWDVDGTGTISETKTLDLLALSGSYSILGMAVIVHNQTDNCVDTTSSGARLAQCVIGVGSPTYKSLTYNNASGYNYALVTRAICQLAPIGNSGVSGYILFEQSDYTLPATVTAQINGLQNGSYHGFHVHEYGDLRDPVNSTGGHFNPSAVTHGIPNFTPRHIGDMGNIYYYDDNGVAWYNFTNSLMTIFYFDNIVGRAVVVHASKDICVQPTGGAGSRLATCVIGMANPSTNVTELPPGVPDTQDTTTCTQTTTGGVATGGASGGSTNGMSSNGNNSSVLAISFFLILAMLFITFA